VGALVLACNSLVQKKAILFFNKTGREKQVDKIDNSLNAIQNLMQVP